MSINHPSVSTPPAEAGASRTPMYRQIGDALRQEIREGVHAPGRQIPTEAEIVERFGVSRITVRRALQELIAEGLLVGQPGRGTFVNDSPCVTALNVLFVHASESAVTYPYTYLLVDGIQRYSQTAHPLRLEMVPRPEINRQSPDDTTVEDLLAYGRLDGIVTMPRIRPEALQRLAQKGVPTVMIGGTRLMDPPPGITVIDVGPTLPHEIALRHLQAIGRSRIGVLGTPLLGGGMAKSRVVETMHRLGLTFEEARYEVAGWGGNAGRDATIQLLSRCPDLDALITSDDMQALGVMQALARLGRRVPEDIAVVGMGNLLDEHLDSGLSTVDVRIREAGTLAAQYLHRLVTGRPVEPITLLAPRLIRRETS